jgi:hypothetical protein
MRVFLSLLALIFLSLIESSSGYSYSVTWYDDDELCTDTVQHPEASRSLVAINAAVNDVLEQDGLPQVTDWTTQVTNNGIRRQLQDVTRGLHYEEEEPCHQKICDNPDVKCTGLCYTTYHCEYCGRRQLILTAGELQDLPGELVDACEAALVDEGERSGIGQYSQECKDAMIAATCTALVWN